MKIKESIVIILDFDGTVVTHEYPRIGKDIGAVEVLTKLVDNGHNLILFTMRSGKTLDEAVNWFKLIIFLCMEYKLTQLKRTGLLAQKLMVI